jgi:hypothetical protein
VARQVGIKPENVVAEVGDQNDEIFRVWMFQCGGFLE